MSNFSYCPHYSAFWKVSLQDFANLENKKCLGEDWLKSGSNTVIFQHFFFISENFFRINPLCSLSFFLCNYRVNKYSVFPFNIIRLYPGILWADEGESRCPYSPHHHTDDYRDKLQSSFTTLVVLFVPVGVTRWGEPDWNPECREPETAELPVCAGAQGQ